MFSLTNPMTKNQQNISGDNDGIYLSVAAPAYNEAENLSQLVKEIAEALSDLFKPWEVVIVNDGSTDDSAQILRKLMEQYPQLRVIALRSRSGQTAAWEAGLKHCRGQYIATLDADLQNDPADIPRLLERVVSGECDFVNGWRNDRNDPWTRLVSTRIANTFRNWITNERIHDSACGLKVFDRRCIESVKLFDGMHRFLPTLVRIEGFRLEEIPVNHRPRIAGKAKYGIHNRLWRGLKDCFAVRWMQKRRLRYDLEEWQR